MTKREASHAGSWYTNDGVKLAKQLNEWLAQVDANIQGVGPVPVRGARVIIAPHAGYAYSGPAAAWAYKALDVSQASRVFLLGPSHHLYLSNCALSRHTHYTTPLGDLPLDTKLIAELRATGEFQDLTASQDSAEHSLEMHLPYIYHILSQSFRAPPSSSSSSSSSPSSSSTPSTNRPFPLLVPIVVGSTSGSTESKYGRLLAPYLADPSSVFVISSDFCHWGSRFSYTYYLPSSPTSTSTSTSPAGTEDTSTGTSHEDPDLASGITLRGSASPRDPPIHASIGRLDRSAMAAIETGAHDTFLRNLRQTGNTVCGRHPIGVIMAAIEEVRRSRADGGGGAGGNAEADANGKTAAAAGRFKFVRYERSSEVLDARDSSVSYASAFAVI